MPAASMRIALPASPHDPCPRSLPPEGARLDRADLAHAVACPRTIARQEIPSGCCGMAGSFGYEHEHYEVSMKVGSLVLFPHIDDLRCRSPRRRCGYQLPPPDSMTAPAALPFTRPELPAMHWPDYFLFPIILLIYTLN